MKVMSVVGARPQFIKLGPLAREIEKDFEHIIVHTGQHYDHEMSNLLFEQLEIPSPQSNLGIGSGGHGEQTGRMLKELEQEMLHHRPALVITFGDTNSTLAACLAASKIEIPSVHVEAGLRSFNRSMPEEINRIIADHTAELLFAPTSEAFKHLQREGLEDKTIVTGDIMVDSLKFIQRKVKSNEYTGKPYYLLTLHRPYNVDDISNIKSLFSQLSQLDEEIVFPIHPRTRKIIDESDLILPKNLKIISPQGYLEFQSLVKYSLKIITDSGGLQKEAYIAGKPCITLRPETEWVETVVSGWNTLMDINDEYLSEKIAEFNPVNSRPDLYGNNVAYKMKNEIKNLIDRFN